MHFKALLFALSIALTCGSLASTRMLTNVYQPLTTFGTEQDAGVVVTKVPILINAVPEGYISAIGRSNKVLQDSSANISDSNLLSLLKIDISAQLVSGNHYNVTLDLRKMGDCSTYGITAESVIEGAVKCLQMTFDDLSIGSYNLKIQANPDDKSDWSRHEAKYESKKTPAGE